MHLRHGFPGLVALGLIVGQASAQSIDQTSFIFRRPACDNCAAPVSGPVTVAPVDPKDKIDQAPVVDQQAFAQAPAAGGELGPTFNPAMFGDQTPIETTPFPQLPSRSPSSQSTSSQSAPTPAAPTARTARIPIVGRGAYKISDNESPRPTDRVFLTYHYYDRVDLGQGFDNFGLHRQTIGFEKTFLDGNVSFGMRLPFLQATGVEDNVPGITSNVIGDVTLIAKYALINDRDTGSVLVGGLALTLDTANHDITLADGSTLHSTLFQPYAGWILNSSNLYLHGFHALVVPTDSRDVTILNNDVGVGFWVYRNADSFLRGIVPTVEGHLFTPLNHRPNTDLITASHEFTLTGGVNFVLFGNSTLGVGIADPLTGPRPNNSEGFVSFNLRF